MATRDHKGSPSHDVIYDWNRVRTIPKPEHAFDLFDETLRDGVQSPSVTDPSLEEKLEILELMDALGIRAADIGLPGSGKRACEDVVAMARHIQQRKLRIQPAAAGRTVLADLQAIDFAVKEGLEIAYVTEDTIRSSPSTLDRLFRAAIDHGASRLVLCDTVG